MWDISECMAFWSRRLSTLNVCHNKRELSHSLTGYKSHLKRVSKLLGVILIFLKSFSTDIYSYHIGNQIFHLIFSCVCLITVREILWNIRNDKNKKDKNTPILIRCLLRKRNYLRLKYCFFFFTKYAISVMLKCNPRNI